MGAERNARFLDRFIHMTFVGRWLVITVVLVFAVLLGAQLSKLQFTSDYRVYFGPSNPQLQAYNSFERIYTSNDTLFIAIQPNEGDVFASEVLSVVEALTEKAWQVPYSVRVDSLTNYQHTSGVGDDLMVGSLVEDASNLDEQSLSRIRDIALSEPILVNRLISPDGRTTGIVITLMFPGADHSVHLPEAVEATRALVEELSESNPNTKVAFTGWPRLSQVLIDISIDELTRLAPFMFGVLILMTGLMLRTWSGVVATMAVVLVASVTAMAFAVLSGIWLTPGTAISPIVVLTIAVADCVHIVMTMNDQMQEGQHKRQAIAESIRINAQPVFLTSLTTMIGFLSLNFSDSPPFQELGNITAVGVAASWVLSMTFLPALLAILPARVLQRSRQKVRIMTRLGDFVVSHRGVILLITAGITLLFVSLTPLNDIDDDFVSWFDESIPARADTDFVQENLTGTYQMEFSIEVGSARSVTDPIYLKDLERFSVWLRSQSETQHVYSLADVMKGLNKSLNGDVPAAYVLPEHADLAAQYLLLYEMSLPYGLDLGSQINNARTASRLTAILRNVTSTEIRTLARASEAWFQENAEIAETDEATGIGIMFAFISVRTIRSMFVGTGIAFLLITGVIILALRNLKLGLLSLLPNVLPVVITFGLWGLFVGQIGMVASLVTALTLGLVVDDTVHMISKYHRARRDLGMNAHDSIRYTYLHVGKAIVATTLILFAGFAVVAQSVFQINEQLGILTIMTISTALLLDLFFLPALIMSIDKDVKCECKSCNSGDQCECEVVEE
jgi:uncharacterized protein